MNRKTERWREEEVRSKKTEIARMIERSVDRNIQINREKGRWATAERDGKIQKEKDHRQIDR